MTTRTIDESTIQVEREKQRGVPDIAQQARGSRIVTTQAATVITDIGVYVAPISVMMVAAWVVTIGLRRFAARFGLLRYVWHPAAVRVRRLHDRAVVDGPARRRALSSPCPRSKPNRSVKRRQTVPQPSGRPSRLLATAPRRRLRIFPLLITLAMIALAVVLGRAMWDAYMGAPWTRDGTVRAYVVTMAPEVAGRIVELPVADNQFVHKGDLLMVIDPTNYKIAVSLAEAAVQQAQANAQNAEREAKRRQELTDLAVTVEEKQTFASNAVVAQAQYQQAVANLDQARVNLERTQIRSPVNGWVTNLLAQLGDYANVGQNEISLVDANSFWVDGYFEETNLEPIRVGDPASIKLMGYSQIVRGHVGSIARGINVAERATQRARARHGQPDLHLGAPGAAHPGAHPHRSGARGRGACGRNDGDRADRSAAPAAGQVNRDPVIGRVLQRELDVEGANKLS